VPETYEELMKEAKYSLLEDGTVYGEIPSCPGVWANEATVHECAEELLSVLDDWALVTTKP
jgi:predicted RNase H-like HicB family nuclease